MKDTHNGCPNVLLSLFDFEVGYIRPGVLYLLYFLSLTANRRDYLPQPIEPPTHTSLFQDCGITVRKKAQIEHPCRMMRNF